VLGIGTARIEARIDQGGQGALHSKSSHGSILSPAWGNGWLYGDAR
jgi:hypothetical protein